MRLSTFAFSILNLLVVSRGSPLISDASLLNNRLPIEMLLLIFEYTEDLSLAEVSKYWYELVHEKYRQRLPKNIPQFADFLRNSKNRFSLPKAKRFLNQRFNSEILPLLWSTWQDPKIDVNSIDNPDECFRSVITKFLRNQPDRITAKSVWMLSKLAYDVRKNRLPGTEERFIRGLSKTRLHKAISKGDEEEVNMILSEDGRTPNVIDNQGWTPLALAASLRKIQMIRLLARYGADPNVVLSIPQLPLHVAASSGFINVLKELVRNFKIDVNLRNCHGETCLHSACEKGKTEVVKYLVSVLGADVNAVTGAKESVLHYAVMSRKSEIIKILLDHGANQFICNVNHNYPIHYAADEGSVTVVNLLLDRSPDGFEFLGFHNRTALHVACRSGSFRVAQCLIDRDFNIDATDCYGFTPLHLTISRMDSSQGEDKLKFYCQIVDLLIEKDANVNAVDLVSGNTPLHLVAERGNSRIVKMLLSSGRVDLSIRNRDGLTAWDVAEGRCRISVMNLIVNYLIRQDELHFRIRSAIDLIVDYQTRLDRLRFYKTAFSLLAFLLGLLFVLISPFMLSF